MAKIPNSYRDLINGPYIGSLSTIRPDGGPQDTALWFLANGDTVVTSLTTDLQKYKNAVRHPKATLFVIDPANPFRTLEVRGDASIEDGADLAVFERLIRHYGQDPGHVPSTPREPRGA